MPKGSICCCGARTWTRFIGWIDLINGFIKFIPSFITLLQSSTWEDQGSGVFATILETLAVDHFFETHDLDKLYIIGWIITVVFFLQIPFSLILLIGSYKTRPGLLRFWIFTFATVLTIIASLGIIQNIVFNKGVEIFQNVFFILVGVIVEGFCIWVVSLHEKEMRTGTHDGDFTQNL